jgi:hypothetical protein
LEKRILALLAARSSVWTALPAFAREYVEPGPYWDHGWGWGWGHMLFGSVMMILFWGGLSRTAMSASGYKQTLWGRASKVRFAPESRHSEAQERVGLKKRALNVCF